MVRKGKASTRTASIIGAIPRDRAAWRQMDLETILSIWHLFRGGITDVVTLKRLTGAECHVNSIPGLVSVVDRAINGPLALLSTVRCRNCGGKLIDIPCRLCGYASESYRPLPVIE